MVEGEPVAEGVSTTEPIDDEFSPRGTLALIALYFVILLGSWVYLYFVEFLGNDLTVIG
ncbi:MAG: hypothetical protein ACLFM8_00350 [Halobacteriales archaeon]